MKDVAKGRNFRESPEKREKQGGVEFLNKVKSQMGWRSESEKEECYKRF